MRPGDVLLETWWTLLLLPLMCLIPWIRGEERWRTGVEAGLAIACGAMVLGLCSGWLAQYHLVGGAITSSDFSEYCQSIAAIRGDVEPGMFSHNRSRLAALVPGLLSRSLGIIDGLAVAALIFSVVIGAGLYVWGRAIHSRLAGVLTAVAFCAVGPLVALPRTVSLYTETISGFVWSAAGAALALRYRSWPALLMGGIGTSLAFLVDVRGLFWALPALGLSLLACIPKDWKLPKAWRWLPLRIALVLGPVALSYPAGSVAFQPSNWTIEQQMMGLLQDRQIQLGLPRSQSQPTTGYLWGYSSPLEIPATLQSLVSIQAQIPKELADFEETAWRREAHIERWFPLLGVSLLLGVVGLVRRPWQLIALLGTLVPFVVALRSASQIMVQLRFIQTPMAAFPIVLAVGLASLLMFGPKTSKRAPGRLRWRTWARPVGGVGLLLAMVLGLAPSWLSPIAPWRFGWAVDAPLQKLVDRAAAGKPTTIDQDYACHNALWRDYHEYGHPVGTRLYAAPEATGP